MAKTTQTMSPAQKYYYKKKATAMGMSLEQYLATKDSPTASAEPVPPPVITFEKVSQLRKLMIDDSMLACNKTGLVIDKLFSYEEGIPVGTNIMCTGDPGVGKTTLLLHALANLQQRNRKLKCLFVCAEMSKIQMFKYTKRFPIFGVVETLFTTDYLDFNLKDVLEQLFEEGWDYILIDSMVEVMDTVKEDCGMSQGQVEKWLVNLCVKHNEAQNKRKVHSSMLLIQQVTKMGVFVGSNKLKHITDAHLEMKRESERDGAGTYMLFTKNRNGQSGVRYSYQLTNSEIHYGAVIEEGEEEGEESYEMQNQETVIVRV